MEALFIVAALLIFCLIAFALVIIRRPKEVAELEKENGWLKEVIQNRDDVIEELQKELSRK